MGLRERAEHLIERFHASPPPGSRRDYRTAVMKTVAPPKYTSKVERSESASTRGPLAMAGYTRNLFMSPGMNTARSAAHVTEMNTATPMNIPRRAFPCQKSE